MDETKPVAVKTQNNTLGLVSLIAGILGILLFCCPYVPILLGVVALICGILGLQQQQQYALAGTIIGGVAVIVGIFFVVLGQLFYHDIIRIIERELMFM